jgi:cytochrome c-type biogenesis protein
MDNQNVTLLTAFIAGMLSFLSPCILPVFPTYMAILAGTGSKKEDDGIPWHFLRNASCFLCGFILVFVVMGATASYFGQIFIDYQELIRQIGAVFMVVMGIHLLGILKIRWLEREYRPLLTSTFQGPAGAFILGIAFTAGWTPCTGPILAAILVYASAANTLGQGTLLLLLYALGFSIPFLIVALLFNNYFYRIRQLYKWLPLIQQLAGIVLAIVGTIMYFDLMQRVLSIIWW